MRREWFQPKSSPHFDLTAEGRELAVEKGASIVLMPVSARKQLFELSDDLATKVTVVFYNDAREAFIKAMAD